MAATVHLLHGFIGSGKTSFARALERDLPALRLTHDEWMRKLHGRSPPPEHYPDHFRRIESLIWDTAASALNAGVDVVLDLGFWTRESRDIARERVARQGATARFYFVDCPRETMLTRTLERSEDPPVDSLWVDRPAFEKLWQRFEPMHDDESYVRIDGTDPKMINRAIDNRS